MRRNILSYCAVCLALAVSSLQAAVVTQYSFDSSLNDTAAAGLTADHLSVFGGGTVTYAPGIVGQAVNINTAVGAAYRLRALDSNDLDLAANFTLEAYIRPDAANTAVFDRLWTKWGDGGNNWHFGLNGSNNGLDLFENGANRIAGTTNPVFNSVPGNRWSHVAIVGNGTTIKGYIDGTEVVSGAYVAPTAGASAMNFGNFQSPADLSFQYVGLIDDARIHNTALTAADLKLRAQALIVPNPTTGLRSYYQFEGNGNDTAARYVANVGTVNDNLSIVGSVSYVPGLVGQAADLNGGYFTSPASVDQNFTNVFTMEGWINPDSIVPGGFQRLGIKWAGGQNSYHFGLFGDDVNLYLSTNGTGQTEVATGGAVVAGQWQHIAAVSDGTTVSLYQNGVLVGSGLLPGNLFQSNSPFGLGDMPLTPGIPFIGPIDEWAFWNTALTPDQIRSHFLSGSQGFGLQETPEPSAMLLWSVLGGVAGLGALWVGRRQQRGN